MRTRKEILPYNALLLTIMLVSLFIISPLGSRVSLAPFLRMGIYLIVIFSVISLFFCHARVPEGRKDGYMPFSRRQLMAVSAILFACGFLVCYSFYITHSTYLARGYDIPKYIYYSKLVQSGNIGRLMDYQEVYRILNTLALTFFSKIVWTSIEMDIKIYVTALLSLNCLLFSFITYILCRDRIALILGFFVSLSSYSFIRMSAGLIDNLFVMTFVSTFIILLLLKKENKRYTLMKGLLIFLMGITHFTIYEYFNILLLCILASKMSFNLRDRKFIDALKTPDVESIVASMLIGNACVILFQIDKLLTYFSISVASSSRALADIYLNSGISSAFMTYGPLAFISMIFFVLFFLELENEKKRIIACWYILTLLIISCQAFNNMIPFIRILLVSPIPIVSAYGIAEVATRIKDNFRRNTLVFIVCTLCIMAAYHGMEENKNLVKGGRALCDNLDEIKSYITENGIEDFALLYSKVDNIPYERFTESVSPSTYYMFEEFFLGKDRLSLVFFGTLDQYCNWDMQFYEELESDFGNALRIKLWYKKIQEHDIDTRPTDVLIISEFTPYDYFMELQSTYDIEKIADNAYMIHIG